MIVFSIDDIEVQLTKEQADLFNPVARKSDKSLPVDVPSTPEMDLLFSDAFEINGSIRDGYDWNPNHKAVCMLTASDGIVLLRGYAQLKNIKITNHGKIIYNVMLYGKFKDIFISLTGKLIFGNEDSADDLDFSEYEHTYNLTTAARSWEFDCDVNSTPTDLTGEGQGYLYPLIDVGTSNDLKTYQFTDFKPAFYYREILYKIFRSIGISWVSDFLDSDMFKRLVFPFTGEQMYLSSAQIESKSASATRITSDQETDFYDTPVSQGNPQRGSGEIIIFNQQDSDPSGQYDETTGEFTAGENCEVIIEGKINGYIEYLGANRTYITQPLNDYYGYIVFEIVKDSGSGNFTPMGSFSCLTFFDLSSNSLTTNQQSEIVPDVGQFQSQPIFLSAGEKLYIKPYGYNDNQFGMWYDSQAVAFIGVGSFVNIRRTSAVVSGQTLDPTICLPSMKQMDFVTMLFKRFNLYVESVSEGVLTIEPRDDFLIDNTNNWERFRATDKDMIISPMSLLNEKQYDFTHEKDDDTINKSYENTHGFVYGRKRVFTENEFLENIKVINDGIAPTPSVSHFDRIIPAIIYTDNSGQVTRKATKPRMLYYGGLKICTSYNIISQGAADEFVQYPYSGMMDDPYNPTLLLTWGIPTSIYYDRYPGLDPLKMTTNDLFTSYWYNTIYQIANKDSRVVEAWFWIDAETYYNASLRDQYWFNNAYHRLIKIEDWVASSDKSLVKCTFLKLQRVSTPEITAPTIGGGRTGNGGTNGNGGDTTIDLPAIYDITKNKYSTGGGIKGGSENPDGDPIGIVIINSNRTVLGQGVSDTSVFGRGVVIPAGQSNVTYINSSLTSPINDVAVINNSICAQEVVELSASDLGGLSSAPLLLLTNKIEGSSIEITSISGKMIFDTDSYQDRNLTIINDSADILYEFNTGFTNQISTFRRLGERVGYDLKPDENIYIEADGILTTGLGTLVLVIEYKYIIL